MGMRAETGLTQELYRMRLCHKARRRRTIEAPATPRDENKSPLWRHEGEKSEFSTYRDITTAADALSVY